MDGDGHGRAIMVLGTTSDAGKSIMTMAICRTLNDMGFSVTPFKSQNMSLNARATPDGHEISLIQELQCIAARIEPSYRVNPILLKPTSDMQSQVIVEGEVFGTYSVDSYYSDFIPNHSHEIVRRNIDALRERYDFVVLEGAGSPAEINIYERDVANMGAARAADADCILITNVKWGGSFAYLLGTIMLIPEEDRKRIKAVIYNNLCGSPESLIKGASELERLTGIPTLGIVPHVENSLPKEDSECFRGMRAMGNGRLRIGVVRLPRISNFSDLDPLNMEDVTVVFVTVPDELDSCDAIIVPGTKNTLSDMRWLWNSGMGDRIISMCGKVPILGICGGYQMLGHKLSDPLGIEDEYIDEIEGLALLDLHTCWGVRRKTVEMNEGVFIRNGSPIRGYQIHLAESLVSGTPLFMIGDDEEGCCDDEKMVYGTYLHGVLDLPAFREFFLGLASQDPSFRSSGRDYSEFMEREVDRVSKEIAGHLDMGLFEQLFMEGEGCR